MELKFSGNEYMFKEGDTIYWAINLAHENSHIFKSECDKEDSVAIGNAFLAKYQVSFRAAAEE